MASNDSSDSGRDCPRSPQLQQSQSSQLPQSDLSQLQQVVSSADPNSHHHNNNIALPGPPPGTTAQDGNGRDDDQITSHHQQQPQQQQQENSPAAIVTVPATNDHDLIVFSSSSSASSSPPSGATENENENEPNGAAALNSLDGYDAYYDMYYGDGDGPIAWAARRAAASASVPSAHTPTLLTPMSAAAVNNNNVSSKVMISPEREKGAADDANSQDEKIAKQTGSGPVKSNSNSSDNGDAPEVCNFLSGGASSSSESGVPVPEIATAGKEHHGGDQGQDEQEGQASLPSKPVETPQLEPEQAFKQEKEKDDEEEASSSSPAEKEKEEEKKPDRYPFVFRSMYDVPTPPEGSPSIFGNGFPKPDPPAWKPRLPARPRTPTFIRPRTPTPPARPQAQDQAQSLTQSPAQSPPALLLDRGNDDENYYGSVSGNGGGGDNTTTTNNNNDDDDDSDDSDDSDDYDYYGIPPEYMEAYRTASAAALQPPPYPQPPRYQQPPPPYQQPRTLPPWIRPPPYTMARDHTPTVRPFDNSLLHNLITQGPMGSRHPSNDGMAHSCACLCCGRTHMCPGRQQQALMLGGVEALIAAADSRAAAAERRDRAMERRDRAMERRERAMERRERAMERRERAMERRVAERRAAVAEARASVGRDLAAATQLEFDFMGASPAPASAPVVASTTPTPTAAASAPATRQQRYPPPAHRRCPRHSYVPLLLDYLSRGRQELGVEELDLKTALVVEADHRRDEIPDNAIQTLLFCDDCGEEYYDDDSEDDDNDNEDDGDGDEQLIDTRSDPPSPADTLVPSRTSLEELGEYATMLAADPWNRELDFQARDDDDDEGDTGMFASSAYGRYEHERERDLAEMTFRRRDTYFDDIYYDTSRMNNDDAQWERDLDSTVVDDSDSDSDSDDE